MNRKVALVTLIEASVVFSDEDKLMLIERVPTLNDRQVQALGKYLTEERRFVLDHEADIRGRLDTMLAELEKADDTVYVGTGKPS